MRAILKRIPRPTLVAILCVPLLLLVDALCYQVALPVTITLQQDKGMLVVGGTSLRLGNIGQLSAFQLAPHNPLIHEYQIDGSDSTNNQDLDTGYLDQIAGSLYYRFQSWMRDLDGTSRWRDLDIQVNGRTFKSVTWPANGSNVVLPRASTVAISLQLQRPETLMSLYLLTSSGSALQVNIDRNNRVLNVVNENTGRTIASTFFPLSVAPFAAMVIDTLVRILLWAIAALLAVQVIEAVIGLLRARWSNRQSAHALSTHKDETGASFVSLSEQSVPDQAASSSLPDERFPLFRALHPVALVGLGCSLVFVIWIAVVEYQGEPHIYDASAYLFAAKMYASGQFSAPSPPLSGLFPGPFMLIWNSRWFAQYEPGTALTLVPGIWLGAPWLVEPILGTLTLLGIGLVVARLYDRRVATLAVLLGCLSPFYSYLAASYLSHAVALFYLVWGLWALLRFFQGGGGWSLPVSALYFGMAVLTRDQVAMLYIALLVPGVIIVAWKRGMYRRSRLSLIAWNLVVVAVALLFIEFYLGFNLMLTGNLWLTPRNLFFPGDRWGFGKGIGFYGQHTLAAGLANLDELLTSLQIDLFGWPFYLTLAFIALPFLLGRVRKADWFLLIALVVSVGSYIGYFYHGIYLGPRYLYEDLPFLLILTARGILTLGSWGIERGQGAFRWLRSKIGREQTAIRPAVSLVTLALVGGLLLCNLIYYMPRQVVRFQNYSGLPNGDTLDIDEIYHSSLHNALVITDNTQIYQQVLFPLNDPELKGNIIYACAETSAQLEKLHKKFPDRVLYLLVVNFDGSVQYVKLNE